MRSLSKTTLINFILGHFQCCCCQMAQWAYFFLDLQHFICWLVK